MWTHTNNNSDDNNNDATNNVQHMDSLLQKLRNAMTELSEQGDDFTQQMWNMYETFENIVSGSESKMNSNETIQKFKGTLPKNEKKLLISAQSEAATKKSKDDKNELALSSLTSSSSNDRISLIRKIDEFNLSDKLKESKCKISENNNEDKLEEIIKINDKLELNDTSQAINYGAIGLNSSTKTEAKILTSSEDKVNTLSNSSKTSSSPPLALSSPSSTSVLSKFNRTNIKVNSTQNDTDISRNNQNLEKNDFNQKKIDSSEIKSSRSPLKCKSKLFAPPLKQHSSSARLSSFSTSNIPQRRSHSLLKINRLKKDEDVLSEPDTRDKYLKQKIKKRCGYQSDSGASSCSNLLIETISTLTEYSDSDDEKKIRAVTHPGDGISENDSIGYAGSNSIDSGYKSLCPTPEVPERREWSRSRVKDFKKISRLEKLERSEHFDKYEKNLRPCLNDPSSGNTSDSSLGSSMASGLYTAKWKNRLKSFSTQAHLDHLLALRQSLMTAIARCEASPPGSRISSPGPNTSTVIRDANKNLRSLNSKNLSKNPSKILPPKSLQTKIMIPTKMPNNHLPNVKHINGLEKCVRFNESSNSTPCGGRPILKDPLCAGLRSQMESGDFTVNCVPEAEIDEILYGKKQEPLCKNEDLYVKMIEKKYKVKDKDTLSILSQQNTSEAFENQNLDINKDKSSKKWSKSKIGEMAKVMLEILDDFKDKQPTQSVQVSNLINAEISSEKSYNSLPEYHIYEEVLYDCLERSDSLKSYRSRRSSRSPELKRQGQLLVQPGKCVDIESSLMHNGLDKTSNPKSIDSSIECSRINPSVRFEDTHFNRSLLNNRLESLNLKSNRLENSRLETGRVPSRFDSRMNSAFNECNVTSNGIREWNNGYSRKNLYSLISDACERESISRSLSKKWEYTCDI